MRSGLRGPVGGELVSFPVFCVCLLPSSDPHRFLSYCPLLLFPLLPSPASSISFTSSFFFSFFLLLLPLFLLHLLLLLFLFHPSLASFSPSPPPSSFPFPLLDLVLALLSIHWTVCELGTDSVTEKRKCVEFRNYKIAYDIHLCYLAAKEALTALELI